MVLAVSLMALLASAATTTFPGGTIDVPEGCTAPANIAAFHDGFFASVKCPKEGLDILFYQDTHIRDACRGTSDKSILAQRESLQLPLPNGSFVVACTFTRKAESGKTSVEEMVIDLGPAQLISQIRTPRQAFLLLQIGMSFRAAKREPSK